jgi:hypothetical protein
LFIIETQRDSGVVDIKYFGAAAAKRLVFSLQFTIKDAEAVKEDQVGLNLGFLLSLWRCGLVGCDQQVIAGFEAIHVQPYRWPRRDCSRVASGETPCVPCHGAGNDAAGGSYAIHSAAWSFSDRSISSLRI